MGHCHILTIQDNFSKHCTAVPLKDIKAHTIAHALATKYVALYGCPKIILSDKGTSFLSKLFNQLGKVLRFHHITTSGYRPQSNGALERSHHVLAKYLKTYIDEFTDWDELLPFAMLSCMTEHIKKWKTNGWLNAKSKPIVNQTLLKQLAELTQKIDVQFKYTPGHQGIYENEKADELAKIGSEIIPT
ncbi:uncharacterized protein LOC107036105 [Diachasma alloeum]|uniref:uncharacterized protein LOC107036105 n=1 Tax=Diachasma alloeum TaxID=454923 RepID=UPI0007381A9D|nr:uncharacterized protein LOC107036105 [Diachasma alloeum]